MKVKAAAAADALAVLAVLDGVSTISGRRDITIFGSSASSAIIPISDCAVWQTGWS